MKIVQKALLSCAVATDRVAMATSETFDSKFIPALYCFLCFGWQWRSGEQLEYAIHCRGKNS